jgi:hypothetical protein
MLKINGMYRGHIARKIAPLTTSIIGLKGNLSLSGINNDWDNEFEDLISIYFQSNSKTRIGLDEQRKMHISLREERGKKIANYWTLTFNIFNLLISLVRLVSIRILLKKIKKTMGRL